MNQNSHSETELRTAVIVSESGDVLGQEVMNGKAFRKSLEQGELWTYNQATGRVLPPSGGIEYLQMDEEGDAIRVLLADAEADRFLAGARASSSGQEAEPAESATPDTEVNPATIANSTTPAGSVADEFAFLQQTVHERRVNPKDGSYTSYLFEQGAAKIRKKVGEEGIEVCLAETPAELVSESADLMFHLSVLLEQESLSLQDVAGELRRRRLEG